MSPIDELNIQSSLGSSSPGATRSACRSGSHRGHGETLRSSCCWCHRNAGRFVFRDGVLHHPLKQQLPATGPCPPRHTHVPGQPGLAVWLWKGSEHPAPGRADGTLGPPGREPGPLLGQGHLGRCRRGHPGTREGQSAAHLPAERGQAGFCCFRLGYVSLKCQFPF